jgi:hypothetical protein
LNKQQPVSLDEVVKGLGNKAELLDLKVVGNIVLPEGSSPYFQLIYVQIRGR